MSESFAELNACPRKRKIDRDPDATTYQVLARRRFLPRWKRNLYSRSDNGTDS